VILSGWVAMGSDELGEGGVSVLGFVARCVGWDRVVGEWALGLSRRAKGVEWSACGNLDESEMAFELLEGVRSVAEEVRSRQ